ncbi:MAG: hypothetical protein JSW72_06620 [Candidatus Bathyarchaeota archaeon]|nr:MAG: hypothetical protein JSW72_06620 [Candidatus Bathyarchaeota archaeon]
MAKKKRTLEYPPRRLERQQDESWPSPLHLPKFSSGDIGLILKRILDRLDAVEKRLENIERALRKG